MAEAAPFALRRILVAIDASAPSFSALEAAADLAAQIEAELLGLFVEDVNLLRAAGHSFVHQVSLPSGAGQPLETQALETQLRGLAAQARRALEGAAERRQLKTCFRVVRGSVSAEVVAASLEADLVILGWSGRSLHRQKRVGGTAAAVAESGPCSVLLLSPGADLARPVVALCDHSSRAERAVFAAARVAAAGGQSLAILVFAPDAEAASAVEAQARRWVRGSGIEADFARPIVADPGRAAALLRPWRDRLLVVRSESPVLVQLGIRAFLESFGGPVLIVR